MQLLIARVGKAGLYNPRYAEYRGIYRLGPSFIDKLSTDHEANLAFYRYCEERASRGYISDMAFAQRLVRLYTEFDPDQHLEILEVLRGQNQSTALAQLLGYDVVAKNLSLSFLANVMLDESSQMSSGMTETERLETAIVAIATDYIRPRLNEAWLLRSFDEAQICAECLCILRESQEMGGSEAIAVYKHPLATF